jgi:hypothetical protein
MFRIQSLAATAPRIVLQSLVALVVCLVLLSPSIGTAMQTVKTQQHMMDSTCMKSMSCCSETLAQLRSVKTELLLKEFAVRQENLLTQDNIFMVVRILLVIILMGFVMVTYVKAKTGGTTISRLVMLALILILISVYWYDNFMIEGQDRVRERVDTIPYLLYSIPSMQSAELRAMPVFQDMTWRPGTLEKFAPFFHKPNSAQLLSYGPLLIIILLLIYRSRTMKKS